MKYLWLIAVVLLYGCTIRPVAKVSFSCVSMARESGTVTTDCADEDTWKAWIEEHRRKDAGLKL